MDLVLADPIEGKNAQIFELKGRVDTITAETLGVYLKKWMKTEKHVVLDMAGVNYVSSAGLRVLLSNARDQERRNKKFVICSLQKEVAEVLKTAGFDIIITIKKDREEAVQACSS